MKKEKPDKRLMRPVKKWHTNSVLKGWDAEDGKDPVHDLSITTLGNGQGVLSIWKVKSFWQRIKFLFHGEITFQTVGTTHPPVLFFCGDVVEKEK